MGTIVLSNGNSLIRKSPMSLLIMLTALVIALSFESDKSKNLPTVPPRPEGEWSNVAVATVVEETTSVTVIE